MAIFVKPRDALTQPVLTNALDSALAVNPATVHDRAQEARTRAQATAQELARVPKDIDWRRLGLALGFVIVLAAAAVASEHYGLPKATDALWGLATTAFGIVVGAVTGEFACA